MESSKEKRSVSWKILLLVLIVGSILITAGIPATANLGNTDAESTNAGDVVFVDVKINPDRNANCLKTMEMGNVKIAVLGSSDFDATTIAPESLEVSSEKNDAVVYPVDFTYEDVSEDGYEDLVLKMNCHEMMVDLGLRYCFCKEIPLTVTGNLKDDNTVIDGSSKTVVLPSLR